MYRFLECNLKLWDAQNEEGGEDVDGRDREHVYIMFIQQLEQLKLLGE